MTVKQTLIQMMCDNGLFESHAERVLTAYMTNTALSSVYNNIWADYPKEFHTVAWLTVCTAVIDWMGAEMPLHFARPMFE